MYILYGISVIYKFELHCFYLTSSLLSLLLESLLAGLIIFFFSTCVCVFCHSSVTITALFEWLMFSLFV